MSNNVGQLTPAGRNKACNALTPVEMSIHNGDPGVSGANNAIVTPRRPVTFGPAEDGIRLLTNEPVFAMPQGSTGSWVATWDADGDCIATKQLNHSETFNGPDGSLKVAEGAICILPFAPPAPPAG